MKIILNLKKKKKKKKKKNYNNININNSIWSSNAENAVRQASRANVSEGEDHNFFQIVNSNPNPE